MEKNNLFHREKEISGHNGAIYSIVADHNFIYSGSADRFVARWKLDEGIQDNFTIKLESPVYAMCEVGPTLFIGLSNGDLHVVDIKERKELKFYQQHKKGIFEIALNAKMNQVYVVDADGNLSVWGADDYKLLIYLPLDCGKVRNISVSPDGTHFVLGGQDGMCRIFNAETFNEVCSWMAHRDGITGLYFDEDRIISGGKDALLKTWTLQGDPLIKPIPAHNYAIYRIVRFNKELILTASRDKTVKVWDNELKFLQRLDLKEAGHKHSVNELTVLDENRFASCGDDARIIIWSRELEG